MVSRSRYSAAPTGDAINMVRRPNVVLMFAHRLRRWSNIKTTFFRCFLFARSPVNVTIYYLFSSGAMSYFATAVDGTISGIIDEQ